MISPDVVGAMVIGLPALIAAWVMLRRQGTALFLFAAALIVVGVGYLTATGATVDIARGLGLAAH